MHSRATGPVPELHQLDFIPEDHYKRSWVYASPVPSDISKSEYLSVGIDEAGRGPVMGPMVYCALHVPMQLRDLATIGVKGILLLLPLLNSKTLVRFQAAYRWQKAGNIQEIMPGSVRRVHCECDSPHGYIQ